MQHQPRETKKSHMPQIVQAREHLDFTRISYQKVQKNTARAEGVSEENWQYSVPETRNSKPHPGFRPPKTLIKGGDKALCMYLY